MTHYYLNDFKRVHTAKPWRVGLLTCFLIIQSVFAVMDHHPVFASPLGHFSSHHLAHGSAHELMHSENFNADASILSVANLSSDSMEGEHSCTDHLHGVNLVALPIGSAAAVEINALAHQGADLVLQLRSIYPPLRLRPPIV